MWSWKASKCQTPNKAEIMRRWRTSPRFSVVVWGLIFRAEQRARRNPHSRRSAGRYGGVCTESWLWTRTAFPVILTHKNSRTGKLSPAHTCTQMSTCMHSEGGWWWWSRQIQLVTRFFFFFLNKCLLADLHQMMKRSRMRYQCADVTQWISELWRLMEILEEPGLHALWKRGRRAGQHPKNM